MWMSSYPTNWVIPAVSPWDEQGIDGLQLQAGITGEAASRKGLLLGMGLDVRQELIGVCR